MENVIDLLLYTMINSEIEKYIIPNKACNVTDEW